MAETNNKSCGLCKHYGANVNQGIWWCDKGHTEHMDANTCEDLEEYSPGVLTATSTIVNSMKNAYKGPNQMANYKVARAKKKRKKERGVKHGRR